MAKVRLMKQQGDTPYTLRASKREVEDDDDYKKREKYEWVADGILVND